MQCFEILCEVKFGVDFECVVVEFGGVGGVENCVDLWVYWVVYECCVIFVFVLGNFYVFENLVEMQVCWVIDDEFQVFVVFVCG